MIKCSALGVIFVGRPLFERVTMVTQKVLRNLMTHTYKHWVVGTLDFHLITHEVNKLEVLLE